MAAPWIEKSTRDKQAKRSENSPPTNVQPSALVARLQQMPRPGERGLPFPRLDDDGEPIGKFDVWVLVQEEIDTARADAEAYTTALMKREKDTNEPNQKAWEENYQSAVLVEVLFRALRDNDNASMPLFRSPEEVRHELSDDEIVHLFEAYSAFQQTHGPLFRVLTADELEEWIEVLSRGADHYPFELCSRGQLVALVISFASLMRPLPTGELSSGTASTDGVETTPNSSATKGDED